MVHVDERRSGSRAVEEYRLVDAEHLMAVFVSLDKINIICRKHRFCAEMGNLLDHCSASIVYLGIMLYVVYYHLEETRPCFWFILSFLLFAASQAVLFLASQPLCEVSSFTTDGFSFFIL